MGASELLDTHAWYDICAVSDILPGTGRAALVENTQIAVVRSRDGQRFYALSNFDPFSKAFVIARGIVGDHAGVPKISSPIFKQSFALTTGQCLDDASVFLPVFPVRVAANRVLVAVGAGRLG